jgi:hypothetical protein
MGESGQNDEMNDRRGLAIRESVARECRFKTSLF